jgi:hypothetical protein
LGNAVDRFERDGTTPAYRHTLYQVKLIREASLILQRTKTQTAIANECSAFEKLNYEYYGLRRGTWTQQRWSEITNIKDIFPKLNKPEKHVAWIFLHKEYPAIMREASLNCSDEAELKNALSDALHRQINGSSNFDMQALNHVRGQYALYRPFFLDPKRQTLVANLWCGEDDVSTFRMHMSYDTEHGGRDYDSVNGVIVPLEGRMLLFQGYFVEKGGPFIFVLRGLGTNSTTGHASDGEGVLLAAASSYLPSAYPVMIVRVDGDVEENNVLNEQLRRNRLLWNKLSRKFLRGVVMYE